jgi:formylglycine-generating enzyme required for sulfatase activity
VLPLEQLFIEVILMKRKHLVLIAALIFLSPGSGIPIQQPATFSNSLGMKMIRIEPGTFPMGTSTTRDLWYEQPVHEAAITQEFFISETEVTLEQYRRFKPDFEGTSTHRPYAAGLSWHDAAAFTEWLSRREGKPYRLPTEAEWEYVARAGSGDVQSQAKDQPEKQNTWGVKNMLAGAREWCLDWFGEYPAGKQTDPVGPESGSVKIVRGGSLDLDERNFLKIDFNRAQARLAMPPSFGHSAKPKIPNDSTEEERLARAEARAEDLPGHHAIGFRVVQGALPRTVFLPYEAPFVQQGVKQATEIVSVGPDMSRPYFRKRYLLPTPLENSPNEAIDALAMHPSFRRHCHSPGLEVLPNGDVLLVIYTSYREYEPGVSLIASRLRFGAEEWDMPSRFLEFVGVNNHAPLCWNDGGTLFVFWGNPKLAEGGFPFQWTSSRDNGATWEPIAFPVFPGKIGSHSRQPINTAFRDSIGTICLSSDGSGGESVLCASDDHGKTWRDTGGRSAGRHTSFALLKDGRILGMGGKNTQIDEFMPKAISKDGGRSYEVSKTPFSRQGTNQRPTLIRLKSGKLLFAGDFVYHNDGSQPRGINQLGCYVALSADEGETWQIKKLIGAQLHENTDRAETMRGPTLGYSVARQAPNGMIHLITTMNNPCLHFEFNEAWILDSQVGERPDNELMASKAKAVASVRKYEERYPGGRVRITYEGGIADDGRFLLHGTETWYYDNGQKQREAGYKLGRKVGSEIYRSREGVLLWSWEHGENGDSIWRQLWPGGQLKAESHWKNFMAEGGARLWDPAGRLLSEKMFHRGRLAQ